MNTQPIQRTMKNEKQCPKQTDLSFRLLVEVVESFLGRLEARPQLLLAVVRYRALGDLLQKKHTSTGHAPHNGEYYA